MKTPLIDGAWYNIPYYAQSPAIIEECEDFSRVQIRIKDDGIYYYGPKGQSWGRDSFGIENRQEFIPLSIIRRRKI